MTGTIIRQITTVTTMNPKILSGGTGTTNITYYVLKAGNVVQIQGYVWDLTADSFTNDQFAIEVPYSAVGVRVYGTVGFNNARLGQMYVQIAENNNRKKLAIILHGSDGYEQKVSGNDLKGKTFQFSITYLTND